MSIDAHQLTEHIIRPALEAIGLWSQAAEELVLGTACQESHCGRYLKQLGTGPALGIFQMEPATHGDLHSNYLRYQPELRGKLATLSKSQSDPKEMVWNLRYAAAMCRIHYRRIKEALPSAGNLNGQASYWKQWYNTPLGSGTEKEYVDNWVRHTR